MNADRIRWTDERLDEWSARVQERLRSVELMLERLIRVEEKVAAVVDDIGEVKRGVESVDRQLRERTEQRVAEHRERERERRADRRWLVGSSFTAAGLIIAAVGLLGERL